MVDVRGSLGCVTVVALLVPLAGCGQSSAKAMTTSAKDSGSEASNLVDANVDAAPTFTLQIMPAKDSEMVALGVPGKAVAFHALRFDPGSGTGIDVTAQAMWSIGSTTVAMSSGGGSYVLQGIGGTAQVVATLLGSASAQGSASLSVMATGSGYFGGATAMATQTFAAATPDPNGAANAPALEYPLDTVVLPGNLPPIDFQWTQAADNNLYRVHLNVPNALDAYLYTTATDVLADKATWTAVAASAPDLPVTCTVDAVGPSNLVRTSAARTLTLSADTIDDSAIYVWQSSTGTFHVLDMAHGTDLLLPTTSASLQPGQPCSGCHRISRDGKRFAFTYNPPGFEFGTLAFDPMSNSFVEKVTPATTYAGTYATFNPLESTQIPALIVTRPDLVAQNTAGTVRLEVRDPDTNAVIPSNVAQMLSQLGMPSPGQATSMPDWSPDGTFVEFAAYDSTTNLVRDLGDDIVLASIVEAPVSFQAGTFTFGTPKVLVAANPMDNPDTGLNNFLPAISPDGTAVAFTRAAGWWSIKTQQSLLNLSGQIAMVRRSDGQILQLVNGSNGAGTTLNSTWPQWAPTLGQRYAWLAYGSERPYGHELTVANHNCGAMVQGQQSCKQLWVMALDLTKLHAGTADPSFAPFWIPGQSINAQYVSPQWTKAVLPAPQ
jgi:hypothetical protein